MVQGDQASGSHEDATRRVNDLFAAWKGSRERNERLPPPDRTAPLETAFWLTDSVTLEAAEGRDDLLVRFGTAMGTVEWPVAELELLQWLRERSAARWHRAVGETEADIVRERDELRAEVARLRAKEAT